MRVHISVIGHTHWDREWYHSAARFRLRLAGMMDELLDLLSARPDYPPFLLDGQAILLEDYASARPERAGELMALLAAGRLETGPWWVLPDELVVSAEALVRNLEEGRAAAAAFGGSAMPVGYSPDAFGHSGALPLLLAGFGIGTAVVWRGLGGEPGQEKDVYRWAAADGSEVLLIHLPPAGYEFGSGLAPGGEKLGERWRELSRVLEARSRSPYWMVLCGADHHAAEPLLSELAEGIAGLAGGAEVATGSLSEYAARVEQWAESDGRRAAVPAIRGELLGGRRHAWLLAGTWSSRLYLKQANARCQRLLERYAEPLAALAAARAPAQAAGLAADVRSAWRSLLENHPHDSICGTSADPVHREMMVRFARCRDQALEIMSRSADLAAGHDPAAARSAGRARWKHGVLVFNPAPRPYSGVVEVEVPLFRADVPVGQGSRPGGRKRKLEGGGLALAGRDGRAVAVQELSRRWATELVESPRHYPDCDEVELVTLAAWARDLPPSGLTAWLVEERDAGTTGPVEGPPDPVVVDGGAMRNSMVALRLDPDGSLTAIDGAGGEAYHGLAGLEDAPDGGDAYTSSPRKSSAGCSPDETAFRVVHPGPLRGELEVVRRYRAWDLDVVTRVTLEAGSALVGVTIEGVNRRPDHRFRVAFPANVRQPRVVADAHFGPVERGPVVATRRRAGELEGESGTAPMQRYVSAARGGRGLTVFADGLPEYQCLPDGTILVTVLRAFGELSRADLPERPGHAAWPAPTPDAQCIGSFTARLAVLLHDGERLDDRRVIEDAAERFHAPPIGLARRSLLQPPGEVPGPALEGEALVISAVRPAPGGDGVVLRCYNPTGTEREGAWVVPWRVDGAWLVRLDGTPLEEIGVEPGGRVKFRAGPRSVVSVRIG